MLTIKSTLSNLFLDSLKGPAGNDKLVVIGHGGKGSNQSVSVGPDSESSNQSLAIGYRATAFKDKLNFFSLGFVNKLSLIHI